MNSSVKQVTESTRMFKHENKTLYSSSDLSFVCINEQCKCLQTPVLL